MSLPPDYKPEFNSLKELLLEMIQERTIDSLLDLIVTRFSIRPHVALCQVWLVRPGDRCQNCNMFSKCTSQKKCLHMVASAGQPSDPNDDWSSTEGPLARIPVNHWGIGNVAVSGKQYLLTDLQQDAGWLKGSTWTQKEKIRGFSATPFVYHGKVLGIIALYIRIPMPKADGIGWFHLVVEQAAGAIANAHAFEELETLRHKLEIENEFLKEDAQDAGSFNRIIGNSPPLTALRKKIELVAPTDASVLITGETGTGKELIAREIHRQSKRADNPMVKVNCASIPSELWESEFFGHIKGAFTGAHKDRTGRFELADGGTLFLDEVGEIPLNQQSRLLRVLQEGQFEKVGGEETQEVDVRIVAATNRNLDKDVAEGKFREDLYYRLNVFPIDAVPLREHRGDIVALSKHFMEQIAKKMGRRSLKMSDQSIDAMMEYTWPGNVRELQNVIERAIITTRVDVMELNLTDTLLNRRKSPRTQEATPNPSAPKRILTMSEFKQLEDENIMAALKQANGRIYGPNGAAKLLKMKPTTLSSRIQKMNIEPQP